MEQVRVTERFESIQGESTFAGFSCFFIRLTGCNLRCGYCDTPDAYEDGQDVGVAELVDQWRDCSAALVEVTGGEPLLQPGFAALARGLRDADSRTVLVETNGSQDIGRIPDGVIAVVDVKTPASGASGSFLMENVERLRPRDEVKFVICDRSDYEWSKRFVADHALVNRCRAVHFSPVNAKQGQELGRWLIDDGLGVRLQVQLHKVLGLP